MFKRALIAAFLFCGFEVFSQPWMMPSRQVSASFNNQVPGQTSLVTGSLSAIMDGYLMPGRDISDMLYDPSTKTWYGLDLTYMIGTNILDMLYDDGTKSWYGLDLTYMLGTNILDMLYDENTKSWYGLDLTYMLGTNILGAEYLDNGSSGGEWVLPLYRPILGRVVDVSVTTTNKSVISGYAEEFGGPAGVDPFLASAFNQGSGVFTVPEDGIYQVTFSAFPVLTGAGTSTNDYANFFVERGNSDAILTFHQYHADDTTNTFSGTWTETDSYDQGDTISFSVQYPYNFGGPRKFTAVANFHFLGPWTDDQ